MVLGSGLSSFVEMLEDKTILEYSKIKGWYLPKGKLLGHMDRFVLGRFEDKWILVMQGRSHVYSGMSMYQVTFPIRVIAALGIETMIITNAAGGCGEGYEVKDFMVWKDHINYFGTDPLVGLPLEDPFVDMLRQYDPELRKKLI